jgi:hypothetical protein
LQGAGYFLAGLRKIEAARSIAEQMNPESNRSASFRAFRDAVRRMAASTTESGDFGTGRQTAP